MNFPAKRSPSPVNRNDDLPRSKRMCASGDISATAAKPKIRKINEVLAVELLEMIIQAVPMKLSTRRVFTQADLSEVTIARQFQLRYLCRLWRNIVYSYTKLTLVLERAEVPCHAQYYVKPAHFRFEQASELFDALSLADDQSLVTEGVNWIDSIRNIELDWNGDSDLEATVSILTRLTNSIQQPVCLDLKLSEANMIGTIAHNFDTSFRQQFPNLTLVKLDLGVAGLYLPEQFDHSVRLAGYYLNFAFTSLVQLHVNMFVLNRAVEQLNVRSDRQDAGWACNSLRHLKLGLDPFNDNDYDYDDAEARTAIFGIQTNLPAWFPQAKLLELAWRSIRFQFDFAILNNFRHLDDLTMEGGHFNQVNIRSDWRLVPLPNIKTFSFQFFHIMPLDVTHYAVLVPNVEELTIGHIYWRTCIAFTKQMTSASPIAFAKLRKLSLDFRMEQLEHFPTQPEIMRLLDALNKSAPNLASFVIEGTCVRCYSPGDLSLFFVIPRGVSSLALNGCLRPPHVFIHRNSEKWRVLPSGMSRSDIKAFYQDWLKELLSFLRQFPALKEFSCTVRMPNIKTMRSLMSEWSFNPAALMAELGVDATESIAFDLSSPRYHLMLSTKLVIAPNRVPLDVQISFEKSTYCFF